jgi:hypothetical protein
MASGHNSAPRSLRTTASRFTKHREACSWSLAAAPTCSKRNSPAAGSATPSCRTLSSHAMVCRPTWSSEMQQPSAVCALSHVFWLLGRACARSTPADTTLCQALPLRGSGIYNMQGEHGSLPASQLVSTVINLCECTAAARVCAAKSLAMAGNSSATAIRYASVPDKSAAHQASDDGQVRQLKSCRGVVSVDVLPPLAAPGCRRTRDAGQPRKPLHRPQRMADGRKRSAGRLHADKNYVMGRVSQELLHACVWRASLRLQNSSSLSCSSREA